MSKYLYIFSLEIKLRYPRVSFFFQIDKIYLHGSIKEIFKKKNAKFVKKKKKKYLFHNWVTKFAR